MVLLVLLLVPLSRLPFLGPGFGSDPDAWRLALAGRTLAETGRYQASRAPGNPVPEFADALLHRGGPVAVNGATALWSAIACAALFLALRRRGVPSAAWAALALAATPIVFVNSVNAMDYVWALAFFLLGFWAARAGQPVAAGICLGLAIGSRLSSVLLVVPLLFMLGEGRARLGFVVAAGLTAAVALSPLFLTYGTGFLRFYETGPTPWLYVLKGASVDLWGLIGTAAVVIALVAALARVARGRATLPPGEARAIATALALYGLLYLRLPHEGAYLIPLVPFVLLFLARTLPRAAMVALCAALWLSAFALKVSEPGKLDSPAPAAGSRTIGFAGRQLAIDPRGPVLWDRARRLAGLAFGERVRARAAALPARSVVVAGEWTPALRWEQAPGDTSHTTFAYLLTPERASALVSAGRPIYYLPETDGLNRIAFGVDLAALGARPLLGASR